MHCTHGGGFPWGKRTMQILPGRLPCSDFIFLSKRTPIYIASFSPICQLCLDFLTRVTAAAIMHCSLKYSASKENSAKSVLDTKNMSTEKMGLTVGYFTVSPWLRFFAFLHFANIKLILHLVVWKLMLLLGPLLSCLCPIGEKEMWHLGQGRDFPKASRKLFLCLIGHN